MFQKTKELESVEIKGKLLKFEKASYHKRLGY